LPTICLDCYRLERSLPEGTSTLSRTVPFHGTRLRYANPPYELDPLLVALLKKVPPADKGWPGPQRVRWFRTFAMNVSQIYDGDGEPVELKIELEGGGK